MRILVIVSLLFVSPCFGDDDRYDEICLRLDELMSDKTEITIEVLDEIDELATELQGEDVYRMRHQYARGQVSGFLSNVVTNNHDLKNPLPNELGQRAGEIALRLKPLLAAELPGWVRLTRGLSSEDAAKRNKVFHQYRQGSPYEQALLRSCLTNPLSRASRGVTRRLIASPDSVRRGDTVEYRYGVSLDGVGVWLRAHDPITPRVRQTELGGHVHVAQVEAGWTDSFGVGGNREEYQARSTPMNDLVYWARPHGPRMMPGSLEEPRTSLEGVRRSSRVALLERATHKVDGSFGLLTLSWPGMKGGVEKLSTLSHEGSWDIRIPELPSVRAALIPVLPEKEELGSPVNGVRLRSTAVPAPNGVVFHIELESVGSTRVRIPNIDTYPDLVTNVLVVDARGHFVDILDSVTDNYTPAVYKHTTGKLEIPLRLIENREHAFVTIGGSKTPSLKGALSFTGFVPGRYVAYVKFGKVTVAEDVKSDVPYWTGQLYAQPMEFEIPEQE